MTIFVGRKCGDAQEKKILEKYIREIQDMYRECETRAGEISTSGRMCCYIGDQHHPASRWRMLAEECT